MGAFRQPPEVVDTGYALTAGTLGVPAVFFCGGKA